jgi:lysophospholipase L1-like esterase
MGAGLRSALARAALVLGGVVVALLVGEIALRLGGVEPARFAHLRSLENPDKTLAVDAYPSDPWGESDLDLRDPAVRAPLEAAGLGDLARVARRTPFGVGFRFDAGRCRNPPVGPRVPGVPRVLVLGDSFTEGQGVREAHTFPRRLEQQLRAEGTPVEVVNCGQRGRDFPEIFADFQRHQALAPDLVLYAMVLNDAVQSPAFRARQTFLNDWILDRRRMLGDDDPGGLSFWQSRLSLFLADRLETYRVGQATTRWYLDMYGADNREGWDATVAFLRAMDAATRARGGRFLVALLPLLVGIEGRYPFAAPAAEIRRACEANGVAFHDVLPAVQGRTSASLWVHDVDHHPNAAAHALFARDLAPVVTGALGARRP